VIDLNEGDVHLSCEPGAGKSTFCMNIARTAIESGNSVIWSCMRAPDPGRFSIIFEGVDRSQLVNFKIIEFGDYLPVVEDVILDNLKLMGEGDLLVIDDWCEPVGRPKKEVKGSLIRILESSKCGVIVSSSTKMTTEQYEMCSTVARGMIKLATEEPHKVFTQGLKGFVEDRKNKSIPRHS